MDKAILLENINALRTINISDYDYIYFGSETCPKLMLSLREIKDIVKSKKLEGKDLVFVTSYFRNSDFPRFRRIVEFLFKRINNLEIVVNDWGAIYFLKQNFPKIKIILGRLLLLGRMPRSPQLFYYHKEAAKTRFSIRESRITLKEKMHSSLYRYLYSGNLSSKFLNVLADLSIRHISIDNLPWLSPHMFKKIKFDIYFPYMLLSVTRYCGLFFEQRKPFLNYIDNCNFECKKYIYFAKDSFFRKVILKKNNAFYIRYKKLSYLAAYAERIVVQPPFY